jgi:prepilin-type N-terminal cleavage/methylation domain-containing protein
MERGEIRMSAAGNTHAKPFIRQEDSMKKVGALQSGFTLVEVLVAFAILSIGMLGVGTMLTHSMRMDKFSERQRQSDTLAMTEMEMIKGMSVDMEPGDQTFNNDWATYRWAIDKDNPTSGMNRVEIEVGWGGGPECLGDIDKCKYKNRLINYVMAPES